MQHSRYVGEAGPSKEKDEVQDSRYVGEAGPSEEKDEVQKTRSVEAKPKSRDTAPVSPSVKHVNKGNDLT